jgi:hypothetical protein
LLQSWKWAKKKVCIFSVAEETPHGSQSDPAWSSRHQLLRTACCVSTKKHKTTKSVSSKCKVCRPNKIVRTIQNQTSKAGCVGWEIFWEMVLYLWIYMQNVLLYSRNLYNFSGNNFVRVINNNTKFSILCFLLNIFY